MSSTNSSIQINNPLSTETTAYLLEHFSEVAVYNPLQRTDPFKATIFCLSPYLSPFSLHTHQLSGCSLYWLAVQSHEVIYLLCATIYLICHIHFLSYSHPVIFTSLIVEGYKNNRFHQNLSNYLIHHLQNENIKYSHFLILTLLQHSPLNSESHQTYPVLHLTVQLRDVIYIKFTGIYEICHLQKYKSMFLQVLLGWKNHKFIQYIRKQERFSRCG